jgi:hypothetical protein
MTGSGGSGAGGGSNPNDLVGWFKSKTGKYPSNADVWWLFKNADGVVDSKQINKVDRGNSLAPNGHYIVDAFYIDRSAVSGIPSIPVETAYYNRPSCVAFFNGRAFWGGVRAKGFGDKIYFTSVLEDLLRADKCFQQLDPTSESNSDLLPSDGGVIVIPGLGELVKLFPVGGALLVFASNGLWQISGDGGFKANEYSIKKVSEHPALGPMSFVQAEGTLFWWNTNGIYTLQPNQVTNDFSAVSVTDETIKTFLKAIPAENIRYVKGAYDPSQMVIQWLFRSTAASTMADHFRYDRILNLRLSAEGAFYPWKISTPDEAFAAPFVSGILVTEGMGSTISEDTVVVDGDPVFIEVDP